MNRLGDASGGGGEVRYKGVRRRRWGKWVSEVRVPGKRERLWLGSFATAEAAAVAYDTAIFYLKGPSAASAAGLNFPMMLPAGAWAGLSPRSIQKLASDRGLVADAELASGWLVPRRTPREKPPTVLGGSATRGEKLVAELPFDISVDDMNIYLQAGENPRFF